MNSEQGTMATGSEVEDTNAMLENPLSGIPREQLLGTQKILQKSWTMT